MRSVAPLSALPGISPSRGEIALSSLLSPITCTALVPPAQKLLISPLEGEMAGRPERGAPERHPCPVSVPGNQAIPK
ncbi:hypothetical protein EN809_003020 [Mesorhizobium sp. M2E.F.Ca.ET.166.01.1.1]|nr:hypothetical protein EN862_007185 [Mesorhizobium sp. M2E.F.Ca.ET.219.01.1.1]TGT76597.1 hypothetical protein EN809_003020 [Mesorhizobium sp. M2E.F.Ca.ET.166.01.1.1]TGW02710.1 hypothetical protein EN797_003020 [Mesorhizobium sp. M2E.F.Ca.ET.154.01.1.1]